MSALGGNASQDLIDAIRSLSREFSNAGSAARGNQSMLSGFMPGNVGAMAGGAVGGPLGAMAGEALGNNIFVNTALKAGRDFGADTASNVLGDAARYGFGKPGGLSFSDSFNQGALKAAANIPFFGDVAAEVTGVQQSAAARLKGLTDPAARGGAVFTAEELMPAAKFFQDEEGRATQNSRMIDELFKKDELVGDAMATSPRFNELLDAANEVRQGLIELASVVSNTVGIFRTISDFFGGAR